MTMFVSVAGRNAELQSLVTLLGSGATAKLYDSTGGTGRPASGGSVGSQVLLATLTFGSDILAANGGSAGNITNGVMTLGGVTQTNSAHVNGTPTWVRLAKSDGTQEIDVDIGSGAGKWQMTGTVVNGQNVTEALTITAGNAGP